MLHFYVILGLSQPLLPTTLRSNALCYKNINPTKRFPKKSLLLLLFHQGRSNTELLLRTWMTTLLFFVQQENYLQQCLTYQPAPALALMLYRLATSDKKTLTTPLLLQLKLVSDVQYSFSRVYSKEEER